MSQNAGIAGSIARFFIKSKLTPLIIISSILLGIMATIYLPREEEPQIIVPMVDIFIKMPGASAKEVEQRITNPVEKLLWEIPGVEYVYSTSSPGMSMAVVRFLVGEDEEKAIVRLQSKLMANLDRMPWAASPPLIKPRYIDDVPILSLTFWGKNYDHYALRRVAAEIETRIKRVDNVSLTQIIGGDKRIVRVLPDTAKMASFGIDITNLTNTLLATNNETKAGSFPALNKEILVHTNGFLINKEDVENIVAGVHNHRVVYIRDIARVIDGPETPSNYVFIGKGPAFEKEIKKKDKKANMAMPAVTLTIAKRKGTNAVTVAENVLEKIKDMKGRVFPSDIKVTTTRNYGKTAKEKSNELLFHMALAIISVSILIWIVLGRKESYIVALAIPVTLALTLSVFYLYGYTLNRITLFALIFSIGILVDDAIVVVENIVRHFRLPENSSKSRLDVAVQAVGEVGNPTILATITVICAILPMAFVGGLMGPYMRPIPVGSSAAMFFSLFIAFIVTPWASVKLLKSYKKEPGDQDLKAEEEDFSTKLYRKVMGPLIHSPALCTLFLASVVILLVVSCSMVIFGLVKVKMLPFDNKSEFQVILDMPESSTLEETTKAALEMGDYLKTINEVTDYEIYSGVASPFNFNGLVRHYYLRQGNNMADIQVNLAEKSERKAQSHDIAKRVRPELYKIAEKFGARIKVAEVPPGPPVLSTLVAEIYGHDYTLQKTIAEKVMKIYEDTPGVVDVDWFMEENSPRYDFMIDKEKAAIHGISVPKIENSLQIALSGRQVGLAHMDKEREDVPIVVRLPFNSRTGIRKLESLRIQAADGALVPLSTLVKPVKRKSETSIYHKNLRPVVYVTADVAGVKESPVYAILAMKDKINKIKLPQGYNLEQYFKSMPKSDKKCSMKWDGEWQITYEVFRDMGISFAVVLILIFVLVVGWFQSFSTPLVIMAAIPFSLIGILPAHFFAGAFFTATSMIGFIAGAGIVVRNSIILVDFIELRLDQGMPLSDAVIDAGAVRFRPMLLTAAAVVVGASVILFDPIFQGLAISLMAGEIASLLFSRMTVPILYYLDKKWEHKHNKS